MKYSDCTFISAYKQVFKDEVSYRMSFIGVDTFKGTQTIAIDASCSEEDYDKVKKLELGDSPLKIIYTKSSKGNYYKVEEVCSVPEPDTEEDPSEADPEPASPSGNSKSKK